MVDTLLVTINCSVVVHELLLDDNKLYIYHRDGN